MNSLNLIIEHKFLRLFTHGINSIDEIHNLPNCADLERLVLYDKNIAEIKGLEKSMRNLTIGIKKKF